MCKLFSLMRREFVILVNWIVLPEIFQLGLKMLSRAFGANWDSNFPELSPFLFVLQKQRKKNGEKFVLAVFSQKCLRKKIRKKSLMDMVTLIFWGNYLFRWISHSIILNVKFTSIIAYFAKEFQLWQIHLKNPKAWNFKCFFRISYID